MLGQVSVSNYDVGYSWSRHVTVDRESSSKMLTFSTTCSFLNWLCQQEENRQLSELQY